MDPQTRTEHRGVPEAQASSGGRQIRAERPLRGPDKEADMKNVTSGNNTANADNWGSTLMNGGCVEKCGALMTQSGEGFKAR